MQTLKITSLGTVQSDDFFEIVLEKFLKKLERNIKKKKYNVLYNEKDTNFYILFNGEEYVLELDSEEKKKILEGKYSDYISRLMKLSNNQPEIYKNCVEIALDTERKEEIIENAEKGILPNDEARVIYLEYLKELRVDVLRAYLTGYNPKIDDTIEEGEKTFLKISLLFSSVGFLIGAGISNVLESIYPLIGFSGFGLLVPTFFIRLNDFFDGDYSFIEVIKQRKIIKHKIKELEKSLNIKKSKSKNVNEVLVPIKTYSYEFKDTIYKEISNVLDKIENVTNKSDKIELKRNVKSILERYNIGLKEAQKGELGSDDVVALQYRIKKEILVIEIRVDGILAKEITESEKNNENAILQKRLEEPIIIDDEEIDGTLRRREENKVPCRVRSLKITNYPE